LAALQALRGALAAGSEAQDRGKLVIIPGIPPICPKTALQVALRAALRQRDGVEGRAARATWWAGVSDFSMQW